MLSRENFMFCCSAIEITVNYNEGAGDIREQVKGAFLDGFKVVVATTIETQTKTERVLKEAGFSSNRRRGKKPCHDSRGGVSLWCALPEH